jgi:single-stranded DNA-binding protein
MEAIDRLLKGARVYCEGSLRLDKWTGQDGVERHGLSCLSWHTRLSAIGRNKPQKREGASASARVPQRAPQPSNDFYSDEIDF